MNKFHPFPVTLFCSVIVLALSFYGYAFAGPAAILISACVLSIVEGITIGLNWTIYPWQVALIAGIPSFLFLIWRMYSLSDPAESSLNHSLFLFFPVISIVSTYFGALIGRWRAIKRKKANESRKGN